MNVEVVTQPKITSITPLIGRVGQAATLNVSGTNLPSTIVASISGQKSGCTTTKSTVTTAVFICPLDTAGSQTLTVKTNTQANAGVVISGGTATFVVSPKSSATGKLNDTGITTCGNNAQNGQTCPLLDYPNQDGDSGRDVTANDDSDGHAGFSFTKLDGSGKPLADQSADYATTQWACVKDNVTGLIWEIKTDDDGLHDKDWNYTWYEPDSSKNGGDAGKQNGGRCGGTSQCDTYHYVQTVNAAGWCGYKDWRMPTYRELRSLVSHDCSYPAIGTAWFPNTPPSYPSSDFWSLSPVAEYGNLAWLVSFGNSSVSWNDKGGYYSVRLVHDSQ